MNDLQDEALEFIEEDPLDGALVPVSKPAAVAPVENFLSRYPGVSRKAFSVEQRAILERPVPVEDLDILPTGEIYFSQVGYRRRLNEAFGPGGWGLVPMGEFYTDGDTLCREYALVVEGRFVSSAIGETDFQPDNARMSKATAAEALKSNALMRCCKDLGIASECWDRRYIREWKKENAKAIWCMGVGKGNKGNKKKLWRRNDAEKFDYPWKEPGNGRDAAPDEDPVTEPVVSGPDPNQKWKEWLKGLDAKQMKALTELAGGMDPYSITVRTAQTRLFNDFKNEGLG